MKVVGWIVLAIVALVAIWLIFFREEKKKGTACGKAIGGATVDGTSVGEGTGETICKVGAAILDYTIGPDGPAQAINTWITGVDPANFRTFNDKTDLRNLQDVMWECSHGNSAACTTAAEQAPGIRCKSGDCDEHSTGSSPSAPGTLTYRDSKGGPYNTAYGKKVPLGGCQADTPGAASNRAAGFCGVLASLTNTIGGSKKAA